jgi:hypothetical protein
VQMAKELGMGPRSLIKNNPNEREFWKAPVEEWIRELYQKRKDKAAARKARRETEAAEMNSLAEQGIEMEIDRMASEAETVGKNRHMEDFPEKPVFESDDEDISFDFDEEEKPHSRSDIEEENQGMLRRQQEFRLAAEVVARAFARNPAVVKVALFGSVAGPLKKEVPHFQRFRRAGIAIFHECRDVDLAVWVDDLDCLNGLRRALDQSLKVLFSDRNIGVAHHQVDVFILEPESDRYRGRLCKFNSCPKKDQRECRVPGCGVRSFLRQHAGFDFDPLSLAPGCMVVLFDRNIISGVQKRDNHLKYAIDDDIPF